MKIRTKPQTYDAIQFDGINDELNKFLERSGSRVYKESDYYVMSNIIGNHRLEIGDYIYKTSLEFMSVGVIRKDGNFDKYFEVLCENK